MKELLRSYKHADVQQTSSYCIPIVVNGTLRGRLRPITAEVIHNSDEITQLTEWRSSSSSWFTTQFPGSEDGTRRWLEHQVLGADDRILFFVEDEEHAPVGQVGLLNYNETAKSCEFDNLLRGRKGAFGNIMIHALIALGEWSIEVLGVETACIHVLGDNYRAMRIYKGLGAVESERVPLLKVEEEGVIRWVPASLPLTEAPERELVTMTITREAFRQIMSAAFHKR
ncbi:GNAT family N-acetyltransferase [Paenibacillus sp. NPDC056722]|uniref:GNAT family N-acetyltransferase n=1 Tax=Paenibacillus sp. NPDC056722 TaxID=3345924 RepID=UPI00368534CD